MRVIITQAVQVAEWKFIIMQMFLVTTVESWDTGYKSYIKSRKKKGEKNCRFMLENGSMG